MTQKYLEQSYGLDTVEKTVAHYDKWATSYETEVGDNGYVLPHRMAQAIAGILDDKTTPLLDFGCGTGLSGLALRRAGFTTLHGMDVSKDMLAEARDKDIYTSLTLADPTEEPPFSKGAFDVIIACGVIGAGAAPLAVLDQLAARTQTGAKLAFSFNDHTLEDPAYAKRVDQYQDEGFTMIFQERGPHLPGINLDSTVYILQRA